MIGIGVQVVPQFYDKIVKYPKAGSVRAMVQPYIFVDRLTDIFRLGQNYSQIATHKVEEIEAEIATHGSSQGSDSTAGFANSIRRCLMRLVGK